MTLDRPLASCTARARHAAFPAGAACAVNACAFAACALAACAFTACANVVDEQGALDVDGAGRGADIGSAADDGDDGAAALTAAPSCPAAVARPARPASCPFVNEVVVYGQQGWNPLADAIADNLSPCTDAFISIATSAVKTSLRPGQASLMHARGPQFHAMAEFHYGAWAQKRTSLGVSWREIGHLFRDEMIAKGYCAGDTWAINEAPSGIRGTGAAGDTFRAGFADLVAGLAEGRPGMPFVKGAVFLEGMGQSLTNFSVYKPKMKALLADAPFWVKMNNDVRFWAAEVYVDPADTCLGSSAAVDRRKRINDYAEHVFNLAAAAPDSAGVNTAQSFLSRTYVPLLNATWDAAPGVGYGDTEISLANMQRHIRAQVDATRAYAAAHTTPDGRIGFGFASYHDPVEWDALGATIASAIRGAYGEHSVVGGACAGEGCTCTKSGANANPAWSSFATWTP